MKFLLSLSILLFFSQASNAQSLPAVDKSPLDVSYFPVNYPVQKIQDKITEPLKARVIYSRPQRANRTIFGGLVQYGELWRLGANEATEIEFFRNAHIDGKKVNKGRYTLYAIVNEKDWIFIINKETDTWGAFKYNPKKDVLRTTIPVQRTEATLESMVMTFEKTLKGCNLVIAWENTKVSIPMQF